jgi:hypothetical protein
MVQSPNGSAPVSVVAGEKASGIRRAEAGDEFEDGFLPDPSAAARATAAEPTSTPVADMLVRSERALN